VEALLLIRITLQIQKHERWKRGSRGSSCSPNFWHGRAGHSSCSPKSLSLLHCNVRLSRIDLDILEFCRSVGRSRTKKLSASGGLRSLTPHQGLCPWTPLGAPPPDPRYGLALHALAMAQATACSPNFQTLPTPSSKNEKKTLKIYQIVAQRPDHKPSSIEAILERFQSY